MDRKEVLRIAEEEYSYFSKIYESFERRSMPRLSPEEIVEQCLTAAQERIVSGKGEDVVKAYAISVAARVVKKLLER